MLAPTTIVAQRATLLENLWNDEFVKGFQAMAQWARDQVPFPGAAFRQLIDEIVRDNALMRGELWLGGREIRAGQHARQRPQRDGRAGHGRARVRRRSRSASWSAGRENRQELLLPGGHVTFGTGRSAFKHTLPRLAEWIGEHSDERNR